MNPNNLDLNKVIESPILTSKYLDPDYLFSHGSTFVRESFSYIFSGDVAYMMRFLFYFFVIFFIFVIFYASIRLLEIRRKEHEYLHHKIAEFAQNHREREKKIHEGEVGSKNGRWREIINLLFSHNQSDWKLAIMESDSMLEDLMEHLGFRGDNLGDKLKAADQTRFRNLPLAWEVHTTRNRIAHEGISFEISHYEAKRVIGIYEQIFREFGYI